MPANWPQVSQALARVAYPRACPIVSDGATDRSRLRSGQALRGREQSSGALSMPTTSHALASTRTRTPTPAPLPQNVDTDQDTSV